MKKKQIHWCVGGAIAAIASVLVLGNLAGVPSATAQVAVPPTHQEHTPADRPAQANQFDDRHDATRSTDQRRSEKKGCKASELIGMEVRSADDENIGSIDDLMIDKEGKVKYAAVSFGGFLGMGDKLFAVPFEAIKFEKTGEEGDRELHAQIDVSEPTLRNKQGFDKENWPVEGDQSFLDDSTQRQVERPETPDSAVPRY